MTTKTIVQLREAATGFDSIDEAEGVIRGVRVLGLKSRNGRRYMAEAASRAADKYSEARVFVDHSKTKGARGMAEWWGVLREVRVAEDGGLRADLHYNKQHPMTGQLIEAAKRFPKRFGLSHVASGSTEQQGRETVVTEIEEVMSVDVVSDPATTQGLFESVDTIQTTFGEILEQHESKVAFVKQLREDMAPTVGQMPVSMPAASADAGPEAQVATAFRTLLVSVIDDEALDTPGKLAKLKAIMTVKDKAQDAITGGKPTDATDPTKTDGAKPADEGKKQPAQESDDVAALKAENANLREELDRRNLTDACTKLLVESGREATEIRVKALMALPEDARKTLVESWPAAAGEPGDDDEGKLTRRRPERPQYSPSIIKEGREDQLGEYPANADEFRKALRS